MDKRYEELIKNWQRRNISGIYCENKEKAAEEILRIIPKSDSIGFSGSVTLDSLKIISELKMRGNVIFNQFKRGMSREEFLEVRRLGTQADYYLASANAISQNGELVFFSAYGNRTSGISYAKNAIIVCGINKITQNLEEAIKRAREYATPLNCRRLGKWKTPCLEGSCLNEICLLPDYRRMCCQVLVIEAEVTPERLKVVLVDENLGF